MTHRTALLLTATLLTLTQTGCIVAGGYTPGGGWFIWPGSFGILILLLLFFLLRRRR